MKIKNIALLAMISLSFLSVSYGAVSPAAREVIDAYIQATGGVDKKQSVKSLTFVGDYSMPEQGIRAPITLHFKKPYKLSTTLEIPNIGQVRSGYNGEIGWELNPVTGFRMIAGSELEQLSKQATVFPELNIEESYKDVRRVEDLADGSVVLELINQAGLEETWIFDPLSHLLKTMKMTIDAGNQGSFPVTTDMKDYREVAGILMPFKTVTVNPAFSMIVEIDEINPNQDIPDHLFEKPAVPQ